MEVDSFASVADAMKDTGGSEEDSSDRFKLVVSILVAVAAITIALIAWGTGIISNKSGDESSAAIASSVKLQQADFDSRLRSLQDHAGYLASRRNSLGADLMWTYLGTPQGLADPLKESKYRRTVEAWDVGLKLGIENFFSSRFARTEIITTGSLRERYDSQKQYETGKAEAAKNNDLDAAGHISGLNALLNKQASLVGSIVVIGLAIWLMTLAYDTQPSYRLYPAGLAVIVYVAGAAVAAHVYWFQ